MALIGLEKGHSKGSNLTSIGQRWQRWQRWAAAAAAAGRRFSLSREEQKQLKGKKVARLE